MSKSLYFLTIFSLFSLFSSNSFGRTLEKEANDIVVQLSDTSLIQANPSKIISRLKKFTHKPGAAEFFPSLITTINIQYSAYTNDFFDHLCAEVSKDFFVRFLETASPRTIKYCLESIRKHLTKDIAGALLKNGTKTFPFSISRTLIDTADRDPDLDQKFSDLAKINPDFFKKLSAYAYLKKHGLTLLTPSAYHLLNNIHFAKAQFFFTKYKKVQTLRQMVNNITVKQQELEQAGYYTFFHGQRWQYLQQEVFFAKLWELKNQKQAPDFLFLHMKELVTDEKSVAQQTDLRKELIRDGRTRQELRDLSLFMNRFYFGNSTQLTSCTANFAVTNDNINSIRFTVEDIFKFHGFEIIFEYFKKELLELEEEFAQLSDYGTSMLIAVPKDKIRECVYLAEIGGFKKSIVTKDGKVITDIVDVLEAFEKDQINETDRHEFVLAMTQDELGGLNPESGIKIFPFNAADPVKYTAYKEKETALLQKIESLIKSPDFQIKLDELQELKKKQQEALIKEKFENRKVSATAVLSAILLIPGLFAYLIS